MSEDRHYPRRLIEVDLPIREISVQAAREKSRKTGTISSVHTWWARRPLASCRSVAFAALLPDPVDSKCPEDFRREAHEALENLRLTRGGAKVTQGDPRALRAALLRLTGELANPEAVADPVVLAAARALVSSAHAITGAPGEVPLVIDPFCGGGAIPLEALRLGADAFASDLNPVSVLINTVLLSYAPTFRTTLATEVTRWSARVADLAAERLHSYYPASADGATTIAYIWARTVTCEGPACGAVIPIFSQPWLAKKRPRVALGIRSDSDAGRFQFDILEDPRPEQVALPTVRRGAVTCPACGYTMPASLVRERFVERAGGTEDSQLLAVVETIRGRRGRYYRVPNSDDFQAVERARRRLESLIEAQDANSPSLVPDEPFPYLRSIFNIHLLGARRWGDLHSARQALAIVELVESLRKTADVMRREMSDPALRNAVVTVLALAVDRCAEHLTTLCRWNPSGPKLQGTFGRQALPIVWDWCETHPFCGSVGDWNSIVKNALIACETASHAARAGVVRAQSATKQALPDDSAHLFFTDPPYYDAVPYADLSDFFYVWLKRSLGGELPGMLRETLTPKGGEVVQMAERNAMYAYKTKENYEALMREAMCESRRVLHPEGLGVVVFAHKKTDAWEVQLKSMIDAGWVITASWPIDTEMATRLRAQNSAVLGSSVHLVCRPREREDGSLVNDTVGDWRQILRELPERVGAWLPRLAEEGVVGADAIFACLGPALEIFSRYARVEKISGERVELGEYLEHVWAAVSQEALRMVLEDADASGLEADARLTAMWLWTLSTAPDSGSNGATVSEEPAPASIPSTFGLEYDAARKIAQGLGAQLEELGHVAEVRGDQARLLAVRERTKHLFGKSEGVHAERRVTKKRQMSLFDELDAAAEAEGWGDVGAPSAGTTTLDRVHQAMLLFGAGRGEALKRFLVDEGAGRQAQFWKLAQSLSALYPKGTDEKRWVEGVLSRKKGLGFG